jgi:transcriptional regulator with XRE-family HTH domain
VSETIGQRVKRLREATPTQNKQRLADLRRANRARAERGQGPLPVPYMSQRELAGPGVSYAYISRIEADSRRPSVKALRVLAGKLGVEVAYLESGEDVVELLLPREDAAALLVRFTGAGESDEVFATDSVYSALVEELRRHVTVEDMETANGRESEPLVVATAGC